MKTHLCFSTSSPPLCLPSDTGEVRTPSTMNDASDLHLQSTTLACSVAIDIVRPAVHLETPIFRHRRRALRAALLEFSSAPHPIHAPTLITPITREKDRREVTVDDSGLHIPPPYDADMRIVQTI